MPPENRVDVLIIGAGPAGIMCANALAIAGANVRIIDKSPVRVLTGQADGIHARTIEVLQSYGLAGRLLREGNQLHMYTYYTPGPDGGIECTGRLPSLPMPTTARYPFIVTLHQGGIEALFLDSMKERGVEVERSRRPVDIKFSEDIEDILSPLSYPVKVTLAHLDAIDESKTEIVHAKYVVGADGAHSWVRKYFGIEMEGEQTEDIWGVVDFVPETNFPDIRNPTGIHSVNGSCLIVPREGDLVRFYVQLLDAKVVDTLTGRAVKSKMTPPKLVSVLRKILHPFELADPKEIDWWTIYIIGQRVASSYFVKDRVFIAGDACHTHSPKGGQGMNASMNDTHNLVWKLAHVLRGWSNTSLLKTYEEERRKYAQDLIDFDKELAALYSKKPKTAENGDGISPEQLLQAYRKTGNFSAGIGIRYSSSAIVDPKHQKCAENLIIGERMLPQIFVRAADIRPVEIQDLLPADIRFKVLFFVGNLTESRVTELEVLAEELNKPLSFLHKYTPDKNVGTVFDIITIAAGTKNDISYLRVPAFFRPHWTKVLLDDTNMTETKGGQGYEAFGIDPSQITIVVVRPDGYVGTIAPSTAAADLDNYFGSFLVPRGPDS